MSNRPIQCKCPRGPDTVGLISARFGWEQWGAQVSRRRIEGRGSQYSARRVAVIRTWPSIEPVLFAATASGNAFEPATSDRTLTLQLIPSDSLRSQPCQPLRRW